ncbi:MAG: hypothetical protein QXS02_03075 [Candidatus Thermoplasmatota archaeon]
MKVIGLLSTEDEANEIRYIAQVCTVADRIRFLVHIEKVKQILKEVKEKQDNITGGISGNQE